MTEQGHAAKAKRGGGGGDPAASWSSPGAPGDRTETRGEQAVRSLLRNALGAEPCLDAEPSQLLRGAARYQTQSHRHERKPETGCHAVGARQERASTPTPTPTMTRVVHWSDSVQGVVQHEEIVRDESHFSGRSLPASDALATRRHERVGSITASRTNQARPDRAPKKVIAPDDCPVRSGPCSYSGESHRSSRGCAVSTAPAGLPGRCGDSLSSVDCPTGRSPGKRCAVHESDAGKKSVPLGRFARAIRPPEPNQEKGRRRGGEVALMEPPNRSLTDTATRFFRGLPHSRTAGPMIYRLRAPRDRRNRRQSHDCDRPRVSIQSLSFRGAICPRPGAAPRPSRFSRSLPGDQAETRSQQAFCGRLIDVVDTERCLNAAPHQLVRSAGRKHGDAPRRVLDAERSRLLGGVARQRSAFHR
jgi:hypothetical protein